MDIGNLIQKRSRLVCTAVKCTAILIVCICIVIYYSATYEVHAFNNAGWVLYYSSTCPHCVKLKNDLHWLTWYTMAKVNCADPLVRCPESVKTVPTWVNTYTGQTSDGVGIFR